MDKDQKLYDLRVEISTKAKRIKVLLENVISKAETELEKEILAGIARDEARSIREMAGEIGMILGH